MKKIALFLAIAFVFGVIFASCGHQASCPAYGDYHQYQRESVY